MKTIRPLQDRLVVKRVDAEAQTPGGLHIPDNAKEKPVEGVVLAVGPGKRGEDGVLWPMAVAVGDRVLFGKYSGSEFKLEGQDVLAIREDDVLGVVGE